MDKDKQIQKVSKLSLERLSEDSKLVKRGLRDLSIWPKIEELFNKLKSQYKAEKYQDCIITAEEILKTDSNHFFTLCYFARSLYFLDRHEEALKILERCLEDEKEYYFLWSFRGDIYYKMGKYPEAVNDYDEALNLELYELLYTLWCQETGEVPERKAGFPQYSTEFANAPVKPAIISFWEDKDDDSNKEEIYYFRKAQFYLSTRAAIYNKFKENDIGKKRAIEALKKVIEINPNNWFAINQIVETLDFLAEKQRGVNNRDALTYIDNALHYDSSNTNLQMSKAMLLYHLEEKESAIELIGRVKEKYPDHDGVDFIYRKINDLEDIQIKEQVNDGQKLYRGTLEKPIVFPESIIITTENIDSIDFDKVIYCEITPKGAMGNEGGILIYVLKSEDALITYEINLEVDAQIFDTVSERISQNANLFISYYGGMGNHVYVKKNAKLEIDEKSSCFWYHTRNTKLKIDSSVQGVFRSVVAEMTGHDPNKNRE